MDEKDIVAAQRAVYGARFAQHGDSPKGTFQNDEPTQFARFAALLRNIEPLAKPGMTLHDLGAGVCDLYRYMRERGLAETLIYSGTEIVQEMVDAAARKYPEVTVLNRDFLDPAETAQYDFVVLSGTFNLPGDVDRKSWDRMCLALIDRMYERCTAGIAFNFLTSYRTFTDPTLHYLDPKRIFDHVATRLSRFMMLDAAYPLYECTLTVLRPELVQRLHPEAEFAKYFRPKHL